MNLLIIDDDEVTLDVLYKQVDRKEVGLDEVFAVNNTAHADEILAHHVINIILCDIEMPGENGIEYLKRIKPQHPDIGYVFLTSFEKFEYAHSAIDIGVAAYLLKPIDIPQINKTLAAVVVKIISSEQKRNVEELWAENQNKVMNSCFADLVFKESADIRGITARLNSMNVDISCDTRLSLIVIRMKSDKFFSNPMPGELNDFIVDNILADLFTASAKMCQILHREEDGNYIAVLSRLDEQEIILKLNQFKLLLSKYNITSVQALYYAPLQELENINCAWNTIKQYDQSHLFSNIAYLSISQLKDPERLSAGKTDAKYIVSCLDNGKRIQLLKYLQKQITSDNSSIKSKDELKVIQKEVEEVLYAYCYNSHLNQIDRNLPLSFKASESSLNMMQWAAYCVNSIFDQIDARKNNDDIVNQFIAYIRNNYDQDISRYTLADMGGITPEYAGRIFRKQTGQGITEYVTDIRMQKAKQLLEYSDYKISDIAMNVGYTNIPYFTNVFKKKYGISPKAYRNSSKKSY